MKFAVALENTEQSMDLLEEFFKQMSFCSNYTLEVYTVEEMEEEEKEVSELKRKVEKRLEKEAITGEVVIEQGDPVDRVAQLVEDREPDIFVASYEHSVFSSSFFEQVRDRIDVPILVLK